MAGAVFASAGIAQLGCATEAGEDVGEAEGEIGASPAAAGIKAGSLEEEGVLLLVNDRAVTSEILKTRTMLTASVAKSIIAFRTTAEGAPRWFSTIDEIDALPLTGTVTFQRLVADAKTSGYTEAPGFDPPTLAKITVPPNLGRPPTANDVVVEAGFDGKPAAEAALLVRGRITNAVVASKESFVAQTIKDNHKAFTLAVGNLFAQGSPHAAFAQSLGAEKLTMLGTMSALKPTILLAEKAGTKTYYARGESGRYETIPVPSYPVIMRAKIRLATNADNDPGQGVRVFYPAWSAKVLAPPVPDAGADSGNDSGNDSGSDGGRNDAGAGNDAAPTGNDAGSGGSDASTAPDSGNDAGGDPGSGTPGTTPSSPPGTLPEALPQESTSDPFSEPTGETSERRGKESAEEEEILPKKKSGSSDSGGCSASPRGARDASWATLLVGALALGSLRRRRR